MKKRMEKIEVNEIKMLYFLKDKKLTNLQLVGLRNIEGPNY